ncbi:LacI family DNA-binding transcriptional regulator [Aurantimonas sp. VKM B-3413]|uniref:LacI family DNA-binding transcriptional regulator n=1 Tax=Aurantimonas sp. VKM B-3413 TaxID=2779401 RepID=UPI001E595847|nr:LacI family DNA-binding transcriptional regulator [Aurantimonas sp. VKM B-3413]MCB8838077.1 LacI family transcriptional regulator [Aurantimonas sp. VKM B-3413]
MASVKWLVLPPPEGGGKQREREFGGAMAKQPTLTDVARAAGVSRSTAARALSGSGYVAKAKRELIEAQANGLGYRASAIARTLRTRRSHTVGILIADITNPIFPRIVRGADEVLTGEGMTLLLCNTDQEPERQASFTQVMIERMADGLILVSQSIRPELVDLLRRGPPIVLVNRTPEPGAFDYVGPDNAQGIDALIEHLTNHGHRRLGFIRGPRNSSTACERYDRFVRRMGELALPLPRSAIFDGDYSPESGRAAADAMLNLPATERPTAILAANDFVALGLIDRARELGFAIPQDLSVTGFDDAFGEAAWHRVFPDAPRMTTVGQPRREIGRQAANLLLDRLADTSRAPTKIIVPVSFIQGTTTAALAPQPSLPSPRRRRGRTM